MAIEEHHQLCTRAKQFAARIVRLSNHLPRTREGDVFAKQLLRSGTSVAANYRAAGRSKSRTDFVCKIATTVEEADETVFWLELLIDSGMVKRTLLEPLLREARELLAIFSASKRTAKATAMRR